MFLLEDMGNLRALSSEVLKILMNNYDRMDKHIGRNSKVEIIRDPEKAYKIINEPNCVLMVLRYGQDDLFAFKKNWDGFNVRELDDYDDMIRDLSWSERPNLQSTIKSVSGIKSFISKLATFIVNRYSTDDKKLVKKNVVAKMNFQVIYEDAEREKTKAERNKSRGNLLRVADRKSTHYLNNKVHGSVYDPRSSKDFKDSLKYRLKEFITNKLPKFDDPNNLPKDLKFLKPDTRFKLMGCPYHYDSYGSSSSDVSSIINENKPMLFAFENEKRYEEDYRYYPRHIVFVVRMNENYQLYVSSIYYDAGNDFRINPDNLRDINTIKDFIEEKKKNDS